MAIRSMTGYGRSSGYTAIGQVSVEIKSVNHRYLDFATRITRELLHLEGDLKNSLREFVTRGRIDLSLKLAGTAQTHKGAEFNLEQLADYREKLLAIAERFNLKAEVTLEQLLALPGVVLEPEPLADNGEVAEEVKQLVKQAADALVASRTLEGQRLKTDLVMRLDQIAQWVTLIESRALISTELYRQKLQENVKLLTSGLTIDPTRLEIEAVLFAERCSITEEVVRLRAHLANFGAFLNSSQAIGRKMDFYLQEMNREVNTIGSKSQDVVISQLVVEIKSELEKVREQVQNIE